MARGRIAVPWRVCPDADAGPWLQLDDGEGWWRADVKPDGCVDLRRFHNAPLGGGDFDNEDYLHICDLDDLIERLQALKIMAETHFGTWPA